MCRPSLHETKTLTINRSRCQGSVVMSFAGTRILTKKKTFRCTWYERQKYPHMQSRWEMLWVTINGARNLMKSVSKRNSITGDRRCQQRWWCSPWQLPYSCWCWRSCKLSSNLHREMTLSVPMERLHQVIIFKIMSNKNDACHDFFLSEKNTYQHFEDFFFPEKCVQKSNV